MVPNTLQEKRLRQLVLFLVLSFFASAAVLPEAKGADHFTATGTIAQNTITQGNFTRQIPEFSPAFESQYVPVPGFDRRYSVGDRLRLNALERLPPRLTVDANCESSFRYELNPFQFPTKGQIKSKIFPTPDVFFNLDPATQNQLLDLLTLVNKSDVAYRVIPNLTVGWMLTPRLKAFSNYFFIKDTFLGRDHILSTNSHSISGGLHHDLPFKKRFTLSSDFQFRELFVKEADPLFDFLPSLTLSCAVTPRTSVFANTLLQLRGIKYFQAPTAEIDPFYTIGMSHQRGQWSLTSSLLLVTNYRSVFLGKNSEIQQDPFAFIYDTELSRPISKRFPSLRGFLRTEHIWNFHTNNSPGSSGYDFRLFWGAKMAVGKPSEYAFIDEIRRQLQLKEGIGAAPTSGTTN
ncbi:MAG: hypothetical protein K2X77_16785 [Candidatus Obscuribacterales bacterium]|nr:hypothetical protein [Candidatus Obscuribacterales bacterium]